MPGGLQIPCAKGCGGLIAVSSEQLQEMITAGGSFQVAHDACVPLSDKTTRRFKAVIQIFEIHPPEEINDGDPNTPSVLVTDAEEMVVQVGTGKEYVVAASFREAYLPLGQKLVQQWERVSGMVDTVDATPPAEDNKS